MDALKGETHKLKEEKSSLLARMTELHTEAQQGKEVEALKSRLADFQAKNVALDKELSDLRGKYIKVTDGKAEDVEKIRQMSQELTKVRATYVNHTANENTIP